MGRPSSTSFYSVSFTMVYKINAGGRGNKYWCWKLQLFYNEWEHYQFSPLYNNISVLCIGRHDISVCNEFKYLRVIFSNSRSFIKTIRHNVEKQKRLCIRINNLQIFNHTILPILLYGCEIWGFHNSNLIENVQNQFLRSITILGKALPYIWYMPR